MRCCLNTAAKMDQAFIDLLAEKDFEYITVKEICQRAGVHRSTFYLHYETMADLLNESTDYIIARFVRHFPEDSLLSKIGDCPLESLILIDPKYLFPYLLYIRENRKLFQTAVNQSSALGMQGLYQEMFQSIFNPILERFHVPVQERRYTMAFYLHGITALVMEWLRTGCQESVEEIAEIIIRNIRNPYQ